MGAEQSKGGKGGKGSKAALEKSSTFKFQTIRDQYTTIEQVQRALREAGLESSQLIVGVDFTKSNLWQGEKTFGNRPLHTVSEVPNHYELALVSIARTLAAFDDDNLIPVFGFGDTSSTDKNVFSFFPGGRPANGLEEALFRYRTIAPLLANKLAGPTTFAPLIYEAIKIVANTGQFHILVLLADGQVSEGIHTQQTIDAIVAASHFPLSIVMIGVGDGPWSQMVQFDDMLPQRSFDNFQFVALTSVIRDWNQLAVNRERLEAEFALRCLMEVPDQYRLIKRLGFLGKNYMNPVHPAVLAKREFALPPPPDVMQWDMANGQQ